MAESHGANSLVHLARSSGLDLSTTTSSRVLQSLCHLHRQCSGRTGAICLAHLAIKRNIGPVVILAQANFVRNSTVSR